MAGSAGSRGWPRHPGRRCVVASPSWTSQPIRGGVSVSTRDPSGGVTPILACWWRWIGWSSLTPAATREPVALDLQVHPGAGRGAHRAGASGQRRHGGRLLREQGYRLQRTVKTLEGAQHVDRDAQFRYLNEQAKVHLAEGSRW